MGAFSDKQSVDIFLKVNFRAAYSEFMLGALAYCMCFASCYLLPLYLQFWHNQICVGNTALPFETVHWLLSQDILSS
jgi:hypothetical protein